MATSVLDSTVLNKLSKQAPFGFHGGLSLDTNKRSLHGEHALVDLSPPTQIVIPLIDYHLQNLSPQVVVNEQVKRGQVLADGIVSSVSGTVQAIEPRNIIHPDKMQVLSAVIDNDELDTPLHIYTDTQLTVQQRITQFVAQAEHTLNFAALSGLGGAGFPTALKIHAAKQGLDTLIINAAECEPEIACDEVLMHTESEQIAFGIDALMQLTRCTECIVAIEDSKPLAIERLNDALSTYTPKARMIIIPTRYPTGAESPLIQTITGKFIPHNEKPVAHGVLCLNIATAHALWMAINGQALDSRIVSIGGAATANPCNVRVRFGTPVSFVLESTGNLQSLDTTRFRAGGPLSGFDLHTLDVPVTAKTNCVTAELMTPSNEAQPCIRCGNCADVCPAKLLPQQLHWYAIAEDQTKCEQLDLDACIECGCCDLVCPASIKLTETFRYAKSTFSYVRDQQQKALDAEQRFMERERRLLRREQAKKEAIEKRKRTIKSPKTPQTDPVSAALARARSKRDASKKQ